MAKIKKIPIDKTELIRIASDDLDTICEGIILKSKGNEELIYGINKICNEITSFSTLSRGFSENGKKIIIMKDYQYLRETNETFYNLGLGLRFAEGTFHNICIRSIGPNLHPLYDNCDKKLKKVNK